VISSHCPEVHGQYLRLTESFNFIAFPPSTYIILMNKLCVFFLQNSGSSYRCKHSIKYWCLSSFSYFFYNVWTLMICLMFSFLSCIICSTKKIQLYDRQFCFCNAYHCVQALFKLALLQLMTSCFLAYDGFDKVFHLSVSFGVPVS